MYIITFTNLRNEWACGPFTSEDQAVEWLLSHGYTTPDAEPWNWWDGYTMARMKTLFDPSTPESVMAENGTQTSTVIHNTRDPLYGEAHERGCGCVICDPSDPYETMDDLRDEYGHTEEDYKEVNRMWVEADWDDMLREAEETEANGGHVNIAVWDTAVANDSNAWCDSCGRMRAYCACNGRL